MKLTPEQERVFFLIIHRELPRFPQGPWPLYDYIGVSARCLGFIPRGKVDLQPARDATLQVLIKKGLLREVKPASREDGILRYVQITDEGWDYRNSSN